MSFISKTIEPPYYAVIFTSILKNTELDSKTHLSYEQTADRMVALAEKQQGFLGIESVRSGENGITVSYWSDLESIENWKNNIEHQAAQDQGKSNWYQSYQVRIAKVEKSYSKF